jgi:hypothetical protein
MGARVADQQHASASSREFTQAEWDALSGRERRRVFNALKQKIADQQAWMDWHQREKELDIERAPRVYAWECANIHPRGVLFTVADVEILQPWINGIWADEGFTDPPTIKVVPGNDLPPDCAGNANRSTITIRDDQCLDTVLLHELAHSIAKEREVGDSHGPCWLGIYMRLLGRQLGRRFNMKELRASATAAGLQFRTRLPRKPW